MTAEPLTGPPERRLSGAVWERDGGGPVRYFGAETLGFSRGGRGCPQFYPPFLARKIHKEKACTYLLLVLLDLYYLSTMA